VLDAFYLEGRVISEAEYEPNRHAMRTMQCVTAAPVTPSRAAIVHPAVATLAIRAQAKRGAQRVAMYPSSNDQMSSATLYALSQVKLLESVKAFQSFTKFRKLSCGHPT
jgi:hypothetical protein